MILIFAIAGTSLLIALWMTTWVLSKPQGPQGMRDVALAIREGAEGFLATQYTSIAKYAVLTAIILFLLYLTRPPAHEEVSTLSMAILTAATFSTGAIMSGMAGYVGMFISVRANVRTAAAATRSYQEAIDVALRGGAVCGLLVVGFCVLGIATLFTLLRTIYPNLPTPVVASLLIGFGFGASLVAMFAQVCDALSPLHLDPSLGLTSALFVLNLSAFHFLHSWAVASTPRPPTSVPTSSARSRWASLRTILATRR